MKERNTKKAGEENEVSGFMENEDDGHYPDIDIEFGKIDFIDSDEDEEIYDNGSRLEGNNDVSGEESDASVIVYLLINSKRWNFLDYD